MLLHTRHVHLGWFDLDSFTHPLNPVDDDALVRLQSALDHLHSIKDPAQGDLPAFHGVLVVDDVDKLSSLVGADGALGDHDNLVGVADRNANAGAHAVVVEPVRVGEDAPHLDGPRAGVDAVVGKVDHAL